jgi:signal transduction histidine kinase
VTPLSETQTPARRDKATKGSKKGPIATFRDALPRGNTLDDEAFRTRHRFLSWILGLHLPSLFAFGVWQGYGIEHSVVEIAVPAACLLFGQLAQNRRVAAFFVTAGLVFCSTVLVHLSGGTIEAHFHFFILIGLIALYQDWVPFVWNVVFTVLSHGAGTLIASDLMFNHDAAQTRPWTWAFIHGVAVLAACVGEVVFWRHTELEQMRNTKLAAELAVVQAEVEQRQSVSELFVNLARRNQSLLDRQLELIGELEQRERSAHGLRELFQLDHLATRIRRNAESLLVLSGDDPPRRWGHPVPLSEVVRAAAAEVEDYQRVRVLVDEQLDVAGRAVADLTHLVAELIENATTFSPPTADVRVRSHSVPAPGARFVLSIEDTGIGMPADDMQAANALLAQPPDVDLRRSSMLGFHVVGRLAKRYGIDVRLTGTPSGGVTAVVTVPDDLIGERRSGVPVGAGVGAAAGAGVPAGAGMPAGADGPAGAGVPADGGGAPATGAGRPGQVAGDQDDAHLAAAIVLGARRVEGRAEWPGAIDSARSSTAPLAPAIAPEHLRPAHLDPLAPGPATGLAGGPFDPPTPGFPVGPLDAGGPGLTASGLTRRVPGAGLDPALQGPDPSRPGPAAGHQPGPEWGDRERVRSMLSSFQANQRAGRAAAREHTHDQSLTTPEESHE